MMVVLGLFLGFILAPVLALVAIRYFPFRFRDDLDG